MSRVRRQRPVGFSHIEYYKDRERKITQEREALAQEGERIIREALDQVEAPIATVGPGVQLSKLTTYKPDFSYLEAGPAMMTGSSMNTSLQPTIAPATPRERFQPLLNEVARLNTARRAAGIPSSALDPVEGIQLRELVGDVPAPYQDMTVGGGITESRIHLDYERNSSGRSTYNPITGKKESVPVIDPVTGTYMRPTPAGTYVLPDGHGIAPEFLMEQSGRLAGQPYVRNVDADNVQRADLINQATGKKADVEVRWMMNPTSANTLPVQIYTRLRPTNLPIEIEQLRGYRKKRAIGDHVNQLVVNHANANNLNVIGAVEDLVDKRVLMDEYYDEQLEKLVDKKPYPGAKPNRFGKALKSLRENVNDPADQMDTIIMPGYVMDKQRGLTAATDMEDVRKKNEDLNIPERYVAYPDSIHLYGLRPALQMLNSQRPIKPGMFQMRGATGYGGRAPYRSMVHYNMPLQEALDRRVATDAVKNHPLIGQLLRNLPYADE